MIDLDFLSEFRLVWNSLEAVAWVVFAALMIRADPKSWLFVGLGMVAIGLAFNAIVEALSFIYGLGGVFYVTGNIIRGVPLFLFLFILVWIGDRSKKLKEISRLAFANSEGQVRRELTRKERTNQQLTQNIDALAHDLQNPITTIVGFSELLFNQVTDKSTQLYTDLDHIHSSAKRAFQIVESLVIYNEMLQLDSRSPTMGKIKTNEMIDDVIKSLAGQVKDVNGRIEVDPDLPKIRGNLLVPQVFQNVISNALKYRHSERDPVVKIRAARSEQRMIRFVIEDNGIGFENSEAKKVFDMFDSPDVDNMGRGIGLTIAQHVVEAHGGWIGCDSRRGHGANFYFTFPSA